MRKDNQDRFSGKLCSILRRQTDGEKLISTEEMDKKFAKFCTRVNRFAKRLFREGRKCFRDHFADSITVKNVLKASDLSDFELKSQTLIEDQWKECSRKEKMVSELTKIIFRGKQISKMPSYKTG